MQAPGAALRDLVKRFLVVEYRDAHHDSHLPNSGVVAAFVIRGECVVNGGFKAAPVSLTGLWSRARTHDHSRDNTVVLVEFTATGAATVVRQPLEELFETTVAMVDDFARRDEVARVHEQLATAPNHGRRIRILEDFLLARAGATRVDPLVSAAVKAMEQSRGALRIEELARRVGLSQSALERRFRRHVGASPRQYASIVRLQHVARLRAAGADCTTIAHAAGYCDQPHFNKDFKRVTGVSPERYFQQAGW